MPRKIIDLSVTLEDKPFNPPHHRPSITYRNHDETWDAMEKLVPGFPRSGFPDGKAFATEQITLVTHAGTHMDAPWHYHPTTNHALKPGGERAVGIDEVPLDWCFQPGVKLDFRKFAAGYVATRQDVIDELKRIGHQLKPLEIVVVNTRAGERYGQDDYSDSNCGMGREATLYLLEQGVRVVGTDAWGWDAPFLYVRDEFKKTGDPSIVWEGHKAGREIGYFQMEKLHNLEALPADSFTVCCFPIKIKGASAGWTRAVAFIDE
jgi:kynurenine formamidase